MRVEIPNTITATIGGLISRGVKAVEVTDGGRLVFTLTDGSTVGIEDVQINAQVDSSVVGTYQTMYSYTDAAGVTGYTSLTVVIRE